LIIVKIIGGLGNQMFQYAYAKALEKRGYEVKIDISSFDTYKLHGGYQLDKYNIDLSVSTREENKEFYHDELFFKILKKVGFYTPKIVKEKSLLFDDELLKVQDNSYVDGYFQSEKYFIDIRNILLKQFAIKQSLSAYTKKIKSIILDKENSCSLHVRRGDFTNSTNIDIHGVCSLEYYQKAIEYLKRNCIDLNFFIFSDDMQWVRENLKLENAIYVDSKENRLPHEDMYLMSLCSHNIIANSSFSWWGAWLNKNNDKIVVAPKRWFADDKSYNQSSDIAPDNWEKI